MRTSQKYFYFLTTLTFLVLIVLKLGMPAILGKYSKVSEPPFYNYQVSDFKLYDAQNKEFSLQDLSGKIFVTDFIFTTCSGVCPLMTKNLKSVYGEFAAKDEVHFVSVTVNPEFDSPQVLAEYAKKYGLDPLRWHFLTGSRESIQDLAIQGFKIGSVEDPVFHSTFLVLADKKAQIRGYYDGTKEEDLGRLKADIRRLLKEKD